MDNRRYSEESPKWVLKREITIKNFTTRELEDGDTELHHACWNSEDNYNNDLFILFILIYSILTLVVYV